MTFGLLAWFLAYGVLAVLTGYLAGKSRAFDDDFMIVALCAMIAPVGILIAVSAFVYEVSLDARKERELLRARRRLQAELQHSIEVEALRDQLLEVRALGGGEGA